MDRDEIQRWLCAPDAPMPSPATVAASLGLPADQLEDTTLLRTSAHVFAFRFTLALLQDRFADDYDMDAWLTEPRCELGGASARDALLAGQSNAVETLAIEEWRQVLVEV